MASVVALDKSDVYCRGPVQVSMSANSS